MTEFRISTALRPRRLSTLGAAFVSALVLTSVTATAQQTAKEPGRNEAKLEIAAGGTVNIVNNAGSVNLKSGNGRQVLIAYSPHSNKVEVDQESTADKKRIEIRTHALPDQNPTADEAKVDYDITIPAGVSVSVSTATAPITVQGVTGDITLSSDAGAITASDLARSHLHVRSVAGAVNLNGVTLSHVDVTSSAGAVQLVNVTGPKVNVGSGSGNITYQGDCSGAGDYVMTTHTGDIDMRLPETASVDLMAHSVSGTVQNDFPLQAKKHTSFIPKSGSSFAGTSNSGSSSVELRSISGKIRVKKQ